MNSQLMKEISTIGGVSGREDAVREYIIQQIKDHCEYHVDNLGNLICLKKGAAAPKNTVIFSAHMDEVGFIVTYIGDDGLLRFTNIGGIDSRVVVGRSVLVGDKGIRGVIGTKAIHMVTEKEIDKPAKLSDLFIDIGATTKEQAEEAVALADRVTFVPEYLEFGDGFIKNKALDDRAGCALLIEMIQKESLAFDTYFVFTTNEETGQAGAGPAAFGIGADIGIIVETTTAGDVSGASPDRYVCHMGGGPVVSFMDKGTIYDHALYKLGFDVSKKLGIPCQTKQGVFGGNESSDVQAAGKGVRVMAVSMPARYIHSPSCVLKTEDIDNTYKLLTALIEEVGNL